MVWGSKTSVNADVSAYQRGNKKARVLGSVGLGVVLAFCMPGQITDAKYTAEFNSAARPIPEQILTAAPTAVAHVELRKAIDLQRQELPTVKTPDQTTKSELVSLIVTPDNQKPVQLASLDLDIPQMTKPRDFIPQAKPVPKAISRPRRTTPTLQKKLFGSVELRFDDERKIKAWSSVYDRFLSDVTNLKSCLAGPCADPALASWAQELRPLQNLSKIQKITAVNNLANRRAYADDRRNYGRSDYWASPAEFLANGGDCEDYAILKFASLLALGVQDQDMRLVVGRLANGTPHAFLATNVGSQEYILDNRKTQVYLTQNRKDYVPKYSMNLSNRWSHVMPMPAKKA
ncbi:MAG: hypothetical protein EX271_01490 [Acidimicrobiales bacterium]|nr:MAG: hypothetical protein EX271_01490 [Acidimicrobiales bacterium]